MICLETIEVQHLHVPCLSLSLFLMRALNLGLGEVTKKESVAPLVNAPHISACCAKSVCAKAPSLDVHIFRMRAVAFQPLAVAASGDLLQPFRKLVPHHVPISCKHTKLGVGCCMWHLWPTLLVVPGHDVCGVKKGEISSSICMCICETS